MAGPVLVIDTAGPRCGVALAGADGRLLAARDPEIGRGHAERLMPLAEAVLAEAGAAWDDVARIAVTVGPGSFTGLRVGVAAARGLALALGVPAVGVSTLEALAEPHRAAGSVLVAVDAKRGEIYLAAYGPGDAVRLAPAALPLDELARLFDAGGLPPVRVGNGVPVLGRALGLPELAGENADNRVDLAALARLGLRRDPAAPPRPLYLRGADAKPQQAPNLRGKPAGGVFPPLS